MTRLAFSRALAAAFLGVAITAGAAHGLSGPSSSNTAAKVDPDFSAAQVAVEDEDCPAAVALLTKVVAKLPNHADAQNLLGYSYRKLGDLDNAIVHYSAALDINPRHRSAHEYIGEAYLEIGDVEGAEMHLKALDKICTFGCVAYRELKRAIKAYKKNLAS